MNQKGFAPILLVVAILVIGGGAIGGGYYVKEHTQIFSQAAQEPASEASYSAQVRPPTQAAVPSSIPFVLPAGWKSLKSSSCLLSLAYPADGEETEHTIGKACQITISFPLQSDQPDSTIKRALYIGNYSKEAQKMRPLPSYPDEQRTIEDIMIAGHPGKLLAYKLQKRLTSFSAEVKVKDMVLSISYGGDTDPKALETFKQILRSIKLTGVDSDYIGDFSVQPMPPRFQSDVSNDSAFFRADAALTNNFQTTPLSTLPKLTKQFPHWGPSVGSTTDYYQPVVIGNYIFAPTDTIGMACGDDIAGINLQNLSVDFYLSNLSEQCLSNQGFFIHNGLIVYSTNDELRVSDLKTNQIKWQLKLQNIERPPVLVGNSLFFTSSKNRSTGAPFQVNSVDISSGKILWSTELKGIYNYSPQVAASDTTVMVVYIYGYAIFDLKTGQILHQKNLYDIQELNMEGGFFMPGDPLYFGGNYYFRLNKDLVAVSQSTGEVVGRIFMATDQKYFDDFIGLSASDNLIYIGGLDNTLSARSADLTRKIWSVDLGTPVTLTPIIAGDFLYAATKNDLIAFNKTTGQEVWRYKLEKSLIYDLIIKNGVIYAIDGKYINVLN